MDTEKKLINRLNRLQGQIEAIKKRIVAQSENKESVDCMEIVSLIKASQGALRTFTESYMQEYMEKCMDTNMSKRDLEKKMSQLIKSVFEV